MIYADAVAATDPRWDGWPAVKRWTANGGAVLQDIHGTVAGLDRFDA
jgi:hypothetical protein